MSNPPNLWDWLCRCASRERDYAVACNLRGIQREEFKEVYYKTTREGRKPTTLALWILRMIGVYIWTYPNASIPDCYPVGHRFERIADILTANFKRKESTMNQASGIQPAIAVSSCAPLSVKHEAALSPEERIKTGEAIIAQAKADLEERYRQEELAARLDSETKLARATQQLLNHVRDIVLGGHKAQMIPEFAQFRKELAPLAESYGFRIVLVGDKSTAVLTQ